MPRIHMLEIKFRDIPETYSPIEVKESEIQLHHGGNALANSNRLEEFNLALELFGELGSAVSDYASGAVEKLVELAAKN